MPFYFKTYGREYVFNLGSDGLVYCKDLKLSAPTVDELKPLVNAVVKKEKSLPRIPVIILEDRWGWLQDFTLGSASSVADRNGYRWVSYLDNEDGRGNKKRRATFSAERLVLDNPRNRETLEQMILIAEDIAELLKKQKDLRATLQKLSDPDDENR